MPENNQPGAWAAALGRLPSGLAILTHTGVQGSTGMLTSWVQQCSFEPPQLTVAMRLGRPILDDLTPGTPFGINIIPDDGKRLLAHFGKGFAPGEPAFEGLEVDLTLPSPCLRSALAWLDCRVVQTVTVGDHVLVVGRVGDAKVLNDTKPYVHVRKDSSRY
ncbi:flavin reductase family protein [soil metagenome]